MTTKDKIEIMKAYTDGKTIESRKHNDKFENIPWHESEKPEWIWGVFEYRIKPEPTYRPYKNLEELLTDFCVKNENEKIASIFGGLWLKDKETGAEYLVNALNGVGSLDIKISETWFTYKQAFEKFVYLNDTPFGIKE